MKKVNYSIRIRLTAGKANRAAFYEFLYLCGFAKSKRKKTDSTLRAWPRDDDMATKKLPVRVDQRRLEAGMRGSWHHVVESWTRSGEFMNE